MMAVPGIIPVTTPVVEPIVATVISLLDQVPPKMASLNTDVAPMQMVVFPRIGIGIAFTVTARVTAQPAVSV